MSVLTSIVMSVFIMVGLTAIVGLLYGEGDVTPSSSSPIRLVRTQALPAVPVCPWALRGWKQFLQEPGFHTCSANSPHADILTQTSTSRLIGLYCRAEPAETGRRWLVIVCGRSGDQQHLNLKKHKIKVQMILKESWLENIFLAIKTIIKHTETLHY